MSYPKGFKPMLAQAVELDEIKFPVLASSKLDGIRCCIFDGVAYSRSLKPIPNKKIQEWAKEYAADLEGLDGEFICGDPTDELVFNKTTRVCMKADSTEDFRFYVFDRVDPSMDALERYHSLFSCTLDKADGKIVIVNQEYCDNVEHLQVIEESNLVSGYEGTMLKNPDGLYKYGRATVKAGQLLKRKLFVDAEFTCVGFTELMHNANEAKVDALGHTERSSCSEGLVGMQTLGSLLCCTPEGVEFGVGTGYTQALRQELWDNRQNLIGAKIKVKYFEIGALEAPRFPVFLGIRHPDDLS